MIAARRFGGQSMIGRLRRVLVKRPCAAFATADPDTWHYAARPDLPKAQQEHDALITILLEAGVEVCYHQESQPGQADAIYVHDPALLTDEGAILLRMGKTLRRGEEKPMAARLAELGVPLLYRMQAKATAEGGDLLWLDPNTLAVGLGFRTNAEGFRQLGDALTPLEVTLVPVQLPYHGGPAACLHLLSLISIVAPELAVVYPPLLSVPFWQYLADRGYRIIEVPPQEFTTMATNVLALEPGKCVMMRGNPVTQQRLEGAGCQVWTYAGDEISLKAEGGPTCLTRPILRDPV
jgi:dimethylargininase